MKKEIFIYFTNSKKSVILKTEKEKETEREKEKTKRSIEIQKKEKKFFSYASES